MIQKAVCRSALHNFFEKLSVLNADTWRRDGIGFSNIMISWHVNTHDLFTFERWDEFYRWWHGVKSDWWFEHRENNWACQTYRFVHAGIFELRFLQKLHISEERLILYWVWDSLTPDLFSLLEDEPRYLIITLIFECLYADILDKVPLLWFEIRSLKMTTTRWCYQR